MKCNVGDCQNETHHRCGICGEPVCQEHGQMWVASSFFPNPVMAITGNRRVCSQCAYKLQEEREQASRELHSVK